MDPPTGREAYRAARDMLLRHRDDYDAAVAALRWPGVGDRFNWALDWFDPIAAGNPRTALRIIDEEPDRLREVGGVGTKTLKKITSSWGEQRGVRKRAVRDERPGGIAVDGFRAEHEAEGLEPTRAGDAELQSCRP